MEFREKVEKKKKAHSCETCNFQTEFISKWNLHIETAKHRKNILNQSQENQTDYYCEHCNFHTTYLSKWNKHIETEKHRKNESNQLNNNYYCEHCNIGFRYNSLWQIHLNTSKHKEKSNHNNNETKTKHYCVCGKSYSSTFNLNKHTAICKIIAEQKPVENNLIQTLCQQNNEFFGLFTKFATMCMEQNATNQTSMVSKNNTCTNTNTNTNANNTNNTNANNTNTNSNNTNFNFNMFLNEDCKNAVTIQEFVKAIQIQDSDLFYAKDHGIVKSLTNLVQKQLVGYELTKRPIHCTDVKRETLHIKETEGWIKCGGGTEDNKLKSAIQNISNMQLSKLGEYMESHPEVKNVNTKANDEFMWMYHRINGETMDEKTIYEDVQKNIAKQVYINSKTGEPL